MRVFLDTEFTDFSDPRLISCGLIAENGSEFYSEMIDGWRSEQCSGFVLEAVLPLLNQSHVDILSRLDAGKLLADWLVSVGNDVTLICDVEVDWTLIANLLRTDRSKSILTINPTILTWPGSAMARHYEILLSYILQDEPKRHHALVDARAMRQAVLLTEAEFRK